MGRASILVASLVASIASAVSSPVRGEDLPAPIVAQGEHVVFQVHAVGAQIYDCKPNAEGALVWQFREPIATLMHEGKTVGRHYAGPTWEVAGSLVVGKLATHAPGATARDVAWLKLSVAENRGDGPLKDVTTVQRVNTAGGVLDGACKQLGEIVAEPYAADYRFLKK